MDDDCNASVIHEMKDVILKSEEEETVKVSDIYAPIRDIRLFLQFAPMDFEGKSNLKINYPRRKEFVDPVGGFHIKWLETKQQFKIREKKYIMKVIRR